MILDAHYVGCYAGRGKGKMFYDYAMRYWPFPGYSLLTIDYCINKCFKYKYAGMVSWVFLTNMFHDVVFAYIFKVCYTCWQCLAGAAICGLSEQLILQTGQHVTLFSSMASTIFT